MNPFHQYVNADGTLNDTLVRNREILYIGTNGRHVERFYVSTSESYIFKPLTNDDQEGGRDGCMRMCFLRYHRSIPDC